jgi:uncharacterized protein
VIRKILVPKPLHGQFGQPRASCEITAHAVARDREPRRIYIQFFAVLADIKGCRVCLFDGNRIGMLRCSVVLDEYKRRSGADCQLSYQLRDLSRVSSWRGPADLVELLRERVGKPTNYDNLAKNLGVSPPTSKAWVELLEKLYLVFLLPPFSSSLSRSIRKDRRVYFFDCAAAYDVTGGAQLENLVACSLLKFTQFRKDAFGENWDVFYLRDKEGREVDFVVTHNRHVNWLIEVKASDGDVSTALRYYTQKLKPMESLQLVLNLERPQEKSGIKLLPLGKWLDALPLDVKPAK